MPRALPQLTPSRACRRLVPGRTVRPKVSPGQIRGLPYRFETLTGGASQPLATENGRTQVAYPRGFGHLYARHVTQANRGCDFDFLEGTAKIEEPEIH